MKAVVLLMLALCSPAMAQVYKCKGADGKTAYQSAPCAGGGTVNLSGAGSSNEVADAQSKAAAMCEAALRTIPAWKDASSLQISDVVRVGFTTIKMHGTTLAVVQCGAYINAKNSYGGYTGKKPAICYMNGTESRVLDVKTF